MNATGTDQVKAQLAQPLFQTDIEPQLTDSAAPRRVFYGLPCAHCGTYYAADQTVCPVCKASERVSPTAIPAPALAESAETVPNPNELEEQRERFLKEFKSQLFSAHMQINAAASFRCGLEENHEGGYEPAAICQLCYERLQDRADHMEAALHMDLKEAAQIIYDAVWADPSDPAKTYQNAATALLTELRKRAGINTVLTTLQPYKH